MEVELKVKVEQILTPRRSIMLLMFVLFAAAVATPLPRQDPGNWTEVAPLPVPRSVFGLGTLPSGSVMVAGGYSPGQFLKATDLYSPTTNKWSNGAATVSSRQNCAGTILKDGRFLLSGGVKGNAVYDSAEAYDEQAQRWESKHAMKTPRYSHALVATNENTALASGGVTSSGNPITSCELYDAEGDSWKKVAAMSKPRRAHGATLLHDGRVMVAGGRTSVSSGSETATVEIYSLADDRWYVGTSLSAARIYLKLVTLPSGKVVAGPGATTEDPETTVNVVELFDPATNAWETIQKMPEPTKGYGMALMTNGMILVAGGSNGDVVQTRCYTLELESAASDYRCEKDACVVVPPGQGVPKAECEAVCGPPLAEYDCISGRCVPHAGGVSKDTCERICRPNDGLFELA